MASERQLIVRVIGDDRSFQQMFARDQKAVQKFGATSTTSLAKADAAFSRTQKLLAGGFVGGVAFSFGEQALRSIIGASSDAERILGQTKVALEATGQSWAVYGKQIENAVQSQSKLGFDDEELLKTFSLFVRQTNNVGEALKENNLAMDVARGRFIDLASAAAIVNKAALGQAGSLRRIGIDAKNGATGVELLRLLTEKYGGAAKAASKDSATSFDRFRVATENAQEALGSLVQGPVGDLADAVAIAAENVQTLTDGLHKVGQVKIPTIHIPFAFDLPGGGSTLGNLAGKAIKIGALAQLLGPSGVAVLLGKKIADAVKDDARQQAPQAAASIASTFSDFLHTVIQTGVDAAKPGNIKFPDFNELLQTVGVGGVTRKLAPIGPANRNQAAQIVAQANGDLDTLLKLQVATRDKLAKAIQSADLTSKERQALNLKLAQARADVIGTQKAIKAANDAAKQTASDAASQARSDKFSSILAGLQLGVDKATLTKNLNDDLSALLSVKAGLEKQIKAGVDVASAQATLVQTIGLIAAKNEEIRQKASDAAQAQQFRALGLSAEGDEVVPGAKNLRQRIDSLLSQISSGDLKVGSKLAGRLRAARALIIKEGDKLTKSTREKINEFIRAANGDDSITKLTGPLTSHSVLQANKLLEGLTLPPGLESALRQRVNAFNNADAFKTFKAPTTTTRGFGAPIVVENHNTITLDGDVVGRSVTKSQQKRRTRNPVQKRGPNRNF